MAEKERSDDVKKIPQYPEFRYYSPADRKSFRERIYDPKEKSFLGRTGRRWVLAAVWVFMLWVSLRVITGQEGPYRTLEDSILGKDPGIIHYPSLSTYTFVTMRANKKLYIEAIEKQLQKYRQLKRSDYTDCSKSPSSPENCFFDVDELGNFTHDGTFGFDQNKPFILLRMNKVYGWKPRKLYTDSNELPEEMPESLKSFIKKEDPQKRNMIWFSCSEETTEGSYLKDVHYWPRPGYPAYFFPFMGKEKHIIPIIAAQFESNKGGVSMKIECRTWAKDMETKTDFFIHFR
ncbi:sodium/potassium-transporting ATPase subunit beta-1-like isoform X2 [Ischnura elegans]|uniref:sodium/potassium-transporting ATPase subunit beta-1-like isoform X2 n=1 Tax=Ischnura elegans TaxID=197161 RepID=UPI001ED889EE|nr:sodium/potassium-transporting ATPase subunit beta-1-like isoform X2 [Ischnura elegans]